MADAELFAYFGIIAAVIGIGFSIVWVILAYKGIKLGSRLVRLKEKEMESKRKAEER